MTYARFMKGGAQGTPQHEPIPGRESEMTRNYAGGYTFILDKWGYLERFLVLGTEAGTYYAKPRKLTVDAAKNVLDCIRTDGIKTVDTTVHISDKGIAPSNDPALFVLALCMAPKYADERTRSYAASVLPKVARTASHLFTFVNEVNELRGWGRVLKRAVADWYLGKNADSLAYQVTKYRQRAGWTHAGVLKLAHPEPVLSDVAAVLDYAAHGWNEMKEDNLEIVPDQIVASEYIKGADKKGAIKAILAYKLTHEMVPNELKNDPDVWAALLVDMPTTAMIRNLGVMSSKGLLVYGSDAAREIVGRLRNSEVLEKARIHPIQLLSAFNTYKAGQGFRGSLKWDPVRPITDALEAAFYESFEYVEPSNKRILLAFDVSGSMSYSLEDYGLNMSCRDASAVMGLVTAKREPWFDAMAFTAGGAGWRSAAAKRFGLSAHDSLSQVTRKMSALPFGGTDCSLPMRWAQDQSLSFDTITIFTDNETWFGDIHPMQALDNYRQKMGLPTKLVVVGMVSNGFSIADPADPYCLDIVGFDTRAPKLISNFSAAG